MLVTGLLMGVKDGKKGSKSDHESVGQIKKCFVAFHLAFIARVLFFFGQGTRLGPCKIDSDSSDFQSHLVCF